MTREQTIERLWEDSGHGTRREDVVAAYEAGEAAERERWNRTCDVVNVLAQVRVIFRREGLKPPAVMLLESREEGMRFLSAIRQTWAACLSIQQQPPMRVMEMADGLVWMECKVMDITVRWPYAVPR